jgi:hypothetical protein
MPIVRCLMNWIGVRDIRHNTPYLIESNQSFMFLVRNENDMNTIITLACEQGLLIQPVVLQIQANANIWSAVMDVKYPTLDLHMCISIDCTAKNAKHNIGHYTMLYERYTSNLF